MIIVAKSPVRCTCTECLNWNKAKLNKLCNYIMPRFVHRPALDLLMPLLLGWSGAHVVGKTSGCELCGNQQYKSLDDLIKSLSF